MKNKEHVITIPEQIVVDFSQDEYKQMLGEDVRCVYVESEDGLVEYYFGKPAYHNIGKEVVFDDSLLNKMKIVLLNSERFNEVKSYLDDKDIGYEYHVKKHWTEEGIDHKVIFTLNLEY